MKRQSAKLTKDGQPEVWPRSTSGPGPAACECGGITMPGPLARSSTSYMSTKCRDPELFYWPDFMPTPDSPDEQLVSRYQNFLDQHVARGMRTIPTFIVGHMSDRTGTHPGAAGAKSSATCGSQPGRPGTSVNSAPGSPRMRPSQDGCSATRSPSTAIGRAAGSALSTRRRSRAGAQILIDAVPAGGGS